MEKKVVIYLTIITFSVIFCGSILYFLIFGVEKKITASPENVKNLEECKVARYVGENAINFVFFSTKEDALGYSDFLLKEKPFNKNADKFNVFYIDDYDTSNDCEIYRGIAILCKSKELTKKAASCPNDYVVVLQEKENSIRSSAYQGVMSLNKVHPLSVFNHEFGHVFAEFAEEYLADNTNLPRRAKNCVADCTEFEGLNEGCYLGCTRSDYYRSIENGVMRTLSVSNYGNFNENVLEERIEEDISSSFSQITGKFVSKITGRAVDRNLDCENQKTFIATVKYSDEKGFEVINEEVIPGCAGGSGHGKFGYRLLDGSGNLILEKNIHLLNLHTEGPGEIVDGLISIEGSEISNPFYSYQIQAPVIEEIDTLQITDEEGRISEINLRGAGGRACIV